MTKAKVSDAEPLQFPSDVGRNDVETAKPSADTDKKSDRYVKIYVVGLPIDSNFDQVHEANLEGVAREAVSSGLHPKGEVTYDGAEEDVNPGNTRLTYSVEVVPAHVDHDAPEVPGQVTPAE